MGKIQKNIFLKIKTSIIKSEKNINQTIHNTRFIFYFFGIFTIFLYFSRFFENLNSVFWKKYANFLTLPQPNFTTGYGFLAIFQRPWVCQGLWKIDETIENCTWWSVEAWEYSFFKNLVFAKLEQPGFSLNIAGVMLPNGPKCLRNEWTLSLLGLDTLWVLKNMVWSHYFAVLSLFMAAEVALPPRRQLVPTGSLPRLPGTPLTHGMSFLTIVSHSGSLTVIFELSEARN